MEVIVHAQPTDKRVKNLREEIIKSMNIDPLMIFDFKTLSLSFRRKLSNRIILVLFVANEQEVECFISHKEWFFNLKVILVLPEGNEELFTKSLELYPRFISTRTRNFKDVTAVLRKLICSSSNKD